MVLAIVWEVMSGLIAPGVGSLFGVERFAARVLPATIEAAMTIGPIFHIHDWLYALWGQIRAERDLIVVSISVHRAVAASLRKPTSPFKKLWPTVIALGICCAASQITTDEPLPNACRPLAFRPSTK